MRQKKFPKQKENNRQFYSHKEIESNRNNIWEYMRMIYVILTSKYMIIHYKIIENMYF